MLCNKKAKSSPSLQPPIPKICLQAVLCALPELNHYSSGPKCFFFPWNPRSIHAKPKESLQCKSVKIIHRQIQKGSTKKLWGSSEESWYSWINKKACPLSLIAPSQWQTPSWQRVSCPAPAHYSDNICHNSICAQSRSGTCWLVDTWPVFCFFSSTF